MSIAKVPENREVEFLNEFYAKSMFTFEGIDLDSKEGKSQLKSLEKLLRETGFTEKEFVGYRFKGSVMNNHFKLTGVNAYPDDLNFLVIPNYYNVQVKLQTGARWFDDIVSNNKIRQNAIDFGCDPDYDEADDDEEDESLNE